MSWKPESYKASEIDEMIKNSQITTPKYQRGSVWSDEQRNQLIDSIKKGFPFGSILLNKKISSNGQVTYDIIDGLQRCTTINQFLNHPGKYFKEDDIEDQYLDSIYNLLDKADKGTNRSETEQSIAKAIVDYVQNQPPTMEAVKSIQYYNVSCMLANNWPSLNNNIKELNSIVQKLFEKFKQTCTELTDVRVPAIIYDGDQALLPDVFERINKNGTALSKYDIYSASWGNDEYDITDSDFAPLYDYICKRYEEMNDSDIRVADFDAVTYKSEKKINTFDLCYSFGKLLKDKYPYLFGPSKSISVDSIGFNMVNSALGKPATELNHLNSNLRSLTNNIQDFLRDILESCKIADDYLKVITRLKGNSAKDLPVLHSENQIISIVISIFFAKYATIKKDDNDRIVSVQLSPSENQTWTTKQTKFKKNVPIIYVEDSLTNAWSGTGDKKLFNIITDGSYYLRDLQQSDFENSFYNWINKIWNERNEEKAVKSPNNTDKIVLNLYTSQTVTAKDAHNSETWDIEHICPKKKMRNILNFYNNGVSEEERLKLPLSSIGNVCYLPSSLNRSKEAKTIYEAGLSKEDLGEVETKFSLTEFNDLEFLNKYTSLSKVDFKNEYMSFLKSRIGKILKLLTQYLFK